MRIHELQEDCSSPSSEGASTHPSSDDNRITTYFIAGEVGRSYFNIQGIC